MFSEANSSLDIQKKNVLSDLEILLETSGYIPNVPEFFQTEPDPNVPEIPTSERLREMSVDTNLEQAIELIKRAKSIDPDGARQAVLKILKDNKKNIHEYYYEQLKSYMNLKY